MPRNAGLGERRLLHPRFSEEEEEGLAQHTHVYTYRIAQTMSEINLYGLDGHSSRLRLLLERPSKGASPLKVLQDERPDVFAKGDASEPGKPEGHRFDIRTDPRPNGYLFHVQSPLDKYARRIGRPPPHPYNTRLSIVIFTRLS